MLHAGQWSTELAAIERVEQIALVKQRAGRGRIRVAIDIDAHALGPGGLYERLPRPATGVLGPGTVGRTRENRLAQHRDSIRSFPAPGSQPALRREEIRFRQP